MIPLRDVIPSRSTPWITLLLIATNLLVFAYELVSSPTRTAAFVHEFGLVPAAFGWVASVTSLFVHTGWLQVGANLLLLWLFGDSLESRIGHGRFLLLYIITGVAGGLAQAIWDPASAIPLIGSSGALAGLIGAYVALFPDSRILVLLLNFHGFAVDLIEVPAVFFVAVWFALQAVSGVAQPAGMPGENLGLPGLIGGCAAGVLGVWIFWRPMRWN